MVYEQFGSQQTLIHPEKQKRNLAALMPGQRTKKDKNRKERRELQITLRVCYDTLIGLLLLAIIVIATFYISHLQIQGQDLAARVRNLETLLEKLNNEGELKKEAEINEATNTKRYGTSGSSSRMERSLTVGERYRAKRSTDCSAYDKDHEGAHERAEHHGIGEHNIAYVSGNIESLRDMISTTNPRHTHYFTEARRRSKLIKGCDAGQLMINSDKSYWWCIQPHAGQKDTMMLARGNHLFKYFTPAPWMNLPCYNRFEFKNGELIIKRAGIYIVHSNIHFTDKSREPGYGVYYKRGEGSEEETELISKCQVSATDKVGSGIFPCPTWQLFPLKAGDRVYMRISDYNWFRIEKETFHLALVKLNDWPGLQ